MNYLKIMKQLLEHYQSSLNYKHFYDILLTKIGSNSNEFIQSQRFLYGYKKNNSLTDEILISISREPSDLRIDVPVWFGDILNSKNRIIVFGREPRDTDSLFNIEKIGTNVFATPFGIDRWNINSSVKRKVQNRYYRVFNDLVSNENNFVIFSDVVKDYLDDSSALNNFFDKARKELSFLKKEIEFVKPTHIITLGDHSFRFIKEHFNNYKINRIRHPSRGGENEAKEQLSQLVF